MLNHHSCINLNQSLPNGGGKGKGRRGVEWEWRTEVGGTGGSGRGGRRGTGHNLPQMGLDKLDLDALLSESDWR